MRSGIHGHISFHELSELLKHERVDVGIPEVLADEWHQRGEKFIRSRTTVDILKYAGEGKVILFEKLIADILRELVFESVAHQSFPKSGTASLVA